MQGAYKAPAWLRSGARSSRCKQCGLVSERQDYDSLKQAANVMVADVPAPAPLSG